MGPHCSQQPAAQRSSHHCTASQRMQPHLIPAQYSSLMLPHLIPAQYPSRMQPHLIPAQYSSEEHKTLIYCKAGMPYLGCYGDRPITFFITSIHLSECPVPCSHYFDVEKAGGKSEPLILAEGLTDYLGS